ncbi:serine/threonine-protein kinase MHK [Dorcoceras hygrometricum]|uniref:Serine/threonine-protein kinase MHK n=1 Tax=Dorcoceras hygrometricum TaxID=472368 RepID=A0A2Z7D3H3_9LAMI|nr:serine/threonine-protein kinase MHK [Dorcoceras hygrometricum]
MGPISNIGPKTSWATRDRPEKYLEEISLRNAAGRLTGHAAAANMLRAAQARRRQHVARGSASPMAAHGSTPPASMSRNQCAKGQQPAAVDPPIRSTTGFNLPPSIRTRRLDRFATDRITSKTDRNKSDHRQAAALGAAADGGRVGE